VKLSKKSVMNRCSDRKPTFKHDFKSRSGTRNWNSILSSFVVSSFMFETIRSDIVGGKGGKRKIER